MVKQINNKHLLKESLVVTILIMLTTLGFQYFPLSFKITKPIKEEFNDFDVYDIIYSGKASGNHTRDTNIIIFQAGNTRREIAGQLHLLQKSHPAVIGIDLTFIGHSDDLQADSLLEQELVLPNIVTGNRINLDSNTNQEIIPNFFDQPSSDHSGYFNFWGDEISVVRYYPPFKKINNTLQYAFTSRIAEKYDPASFAVLQKKYQKLQVINYKGSIESYTSFLMGQFDSAQLSEKIHGKIVLLGVFQKKFPLVLEDLHFTPLNDKINGKSFPDMYGVVIHANILSMIFSKTYVMTMARIWSYLIAVLLTFLLVYYQLRVFSRKKHLSAIWFFLLQFIISIILVYLFLFIYEYYHYKVPLFPMVIPIVLCVEIIEIYKFVIKRFFKRIKYKSVYLNDL